MRAHYDQWTVQREQIARLTPGAPAGSRCSTANERASVVEVRVDDFLAREEVVRQPGMQGAGARDVREQVLHLVREHTAAF